MTTKERLKEIQKKNFKMGKKAFITYLEDDGGLESLNAAVRAFRASMQALRYSIMYNTIPRKEE